MKALKAFIKPSEAPQRSVKIKINLIFISIQLSETHGMLRVNILYMDEEVKKVFYPGPMVSFRSARKASRCTL